MSQGSVIASIIFRNIFYYTVRQVAQFAVCHPPGEALSGASSPEVPSLEPYCCSSGSEIVLYLIVLWF